MTVVGLGAPALSSLGQLREKISTIADVQQKSFPAFQQDLNRNNNIIVKLETTLDATTRRIVLGVGELSDNIKGLQGGIKELNGETHETRLAITRLDERLQANKSYTETLSDQIKTLSTKTTQRHEVLMNALIRWYSVLKRLSLLSLSSSTVRYSYQTIPSS